VDQRIAAFLADVLALADEDPFALGDFSTDSSSPCLSRLPSARPISPFAS
jgi:hypothetical protein